MTSRAKLVRNGYWALTAYMAVTATLVFGPIHSPKFLAIIAWFAVVPIALATLFLLNRKCRQDHTQPQRIFIHAVRILCIPAWLYSSLIVLFWTVLWIEAAQPWPFSLQHGPDTDYARKGFRERIGFPPPSSVSQIYYRNHSGMLDVGYCLRFQVSSPEVVQRIATHKELPESKNNAIVMSFSRPKWWEEMSGREHMKYYARERHRSYYWRLWYDPRAGIVWYHEYSV